MMKPYEAMDELEMQLQETAAAPQQSTEEKNIIQIDTANTRQTAPIRTTRAARSESAAAAPAQFREKLPTLYELVKAAQPGKCRLDELHAGRMLANILKPRFRYNSTAKRWCVYNAGLWAIDEHCEVQRYVKAVIEEILAYISKCQSMDETKKQDALKFWGRYLQKRNRDIMLDDAQKEITIPRKDFDNNMNLLHFNNGTLELDTMTFREHRAADMLTRSTRTTYDRAATFPRWNKFMQEIMQDNDTRKHLQKCFGYALTGNPCEERFFILYGATTRNGKSTMIESIAKAFGDFAITVNPESFASINRNSSAPSDDIARIAGTRLLITSEPKQGMILDVAKIKQMTGGDRITARFLHENSFEFVPSCSIFFNANHKMRVLDPTLFSSDRVDLIEFSRHFSREERDTSLKQQFTADQAQSAIMNWILDGLFLYRKEGLTPPAKVQSNTDQYAQESDKFTLFVNDCIEPAADEDYFTLRDAYERFKTWTKENGFGTESKMNFNQIMRGRFGDEVALWTYRTYGSKEKTSVRVIKGYRLT